MNEDNTVSPPRVPENPIQPETPRPISGSQVDITTPAQTVQSEVFPQPQQLTQTTVTSIEQPTVSSGISDTLPTSDSVSASVSPVMSPYIPHQTNDTSLESGEVKVAPLVVTKPRKSRKKLLIILLLVAVFIAIVAGFIVYNGDKVEAPKTTDPSVTKVEEDADRAEESNKQAAEAAAKQTAVQDIDSSVGALDSTLNGSDDAVDFNITSLSATTLGIE